MDDPVDVRDAVWLFEGTELAESVSVLLIVGDTLEDPVDDRVLTSRAEYEELGLILAVLVIERVLRDELLTLAVVD